MATAEGRNLGQDNIIELNGKRYDAMTGALLGESTTPVIEALPPRPARTIDGIVHRRPEAAARENAHRKVTATSKPTKHPKAGHRAIRPLAPHRPEHAKTLMRHSVDKPKVSLKPAIKPQTPAEIVAKPISTIATKHSVTHVDPVRAHRAHQVAKSDSVKRFTHPAEHHHHIPHTTPAVHIPPNHAVQARSTSHPEAKRPPTDIFEAAIARATSHEQPPHKPARKHRKGKRLGGVAAGVLAFLVLGGFLTYLNMPKIELKVASFQAGFTAHMPSHNPTGYQLADIENQHGKITLRFRSGESSYRISQQASNWNSQTLQDDIIATAGHKTVQSKGRTIYLYDGTASWISGGVRFDLATNNAHLSSDDIVDIATSM
jgi:hypothetical protein